MYRYNLTRPVAVEGISIRSVFLRDPTEHDATTVAVLVAEREKARGKISIFEAAGIALAQLTDLPETATRKLSATDVMALMQHLGSAR